jgi:1,2-diacylglycerol 3-beta-glucosyltransferase
MDAAGGAWFEEGAFSRREQVCEGVHDHLNMASFDFIQICCGTILLLPAIYLGVLTVAGLWGRRDRKQIGEGTLPRIAVVIPAHDEGLLICPTIQAVMASRYPKDRFSIYVIADNCTDTTAMLASACGALVAERTNPAQRGKGFAIDWFLRSRANELAEYDVIALIDADTIVDGNFLIEAGREIGSGRSKVVQGYYGVANTDAGWRASLSEAAFAVSHHLRLLGRNRLGGTASLKGNGMAFEAGLLIEKGWPAHSLVEDLEFALMLLEDGIRVRYLPNAKVMAEMVTDREAAGRQRVRWEGGRAKVVSDMGGRLLGQALRKRDGALLEAWMDLICPPMGLYVKFLLVGLLFGILVGSDWIVRATGVAFALTAAHVLIAMWHRKVSGEVWRALLLVPCFLLQKIPVYMSLLLNGPGQAWVRTKRNGERRESRFFRMANTGKGSLTVWRAIAEWRVRIWSWEEGMARAGKRAMDVAGALFALLLLSPVMVIAAILIKFEDGGPILFRQLRVGKNGKGIQVYKFRSMIVQAERFRIGMESCNEHGKGVTFKMRRDPRVTSVGRWIRKFSIDEMPQFFNVLLGDMSLVGPRPPLPREVACYDAYQLNRLKVKPGITCLWQIQGRADIDFDGQMRLDLEYIHSASLWEDCLILLKTVPAVIFARGAY